MKLNEIGAGKNFQPIPAAHRGQHNNHFRGINHLGRDVFLKVMNDGLRYYTTEVRVAHHLADIDIRTPVLLNHGLLDGDSPTRSKPGDEQAWVAYEWLPLADFPCSQGKIEQAGELLGILHSSTMGIADPELRSVVNLSAEIDRKIARLDQIDPALARRINTLRRQVQDAHGETLESVLSLVHGDFGWRNLGVVNTSEELVVFDFEHASIRHPLWDFAKLWDRELDNPSHRKAFLAGYHRHQESHPDWWLHHIHAIRLWSAISIIVYARPREDQDFENFAHIILDRLGHGS